MINNLKSKPKLIIAIAMMFVAGLLGIILGAVALTTSKTEFGETAVFTDYIKHSNEIPKEQDFLKTHIQVGAAMASLAILLGVTAFILGGLTFAGVIKSEMAALIIGGVFLALVIIFGAIGVQFAHDVFDEKWIMKNNPRGRF